MSLQYDISKCKDYQELMYSEDGLLHPTTQSIIFTTMTVGMGEITEKNVDEFHIRQVIANRLAGEIPFDYEEIVAHIGLRTNVPFETWTKWLKRYMNYEKREILWKAKHPL